jgi:hypothetical protein
LEILSDPSRVAPVIARQATRTAILAALTCFLVALAAPAVASAANVFTVDNVIDGPDEEPNDGVCKANVVETNEEEGTCTLRAAIEEVNHQEDTENTINFDPTVFEGEESGDSIFVSELLGALPAIEFPTKVEGGSSCTAAGVEGAPCAGVIGLEGEPVLAVEADDTKVSGLAITSGSVDLGVYEESTGFEATGNWIGIGLNGSNALPAAAAGILLEPGSDEATIGGSLEADRNVIAFNQVGLRIDGASKTTVRGNWFGVTGDGVIPGPQAVDIKITDSGGFKAEENEIGAVLSEAAQKSAKCDGGCNVISGAEEGIVLFGTNPLDVPASGPTTIHGNFLGLDSTGERAVKVEGLSGFEGNQVLGVSAGAAADVTVGGNPASEANYVVGGSTGVATEDSDGFEASGNRFGYTATGAEAVPQSTQAIFLFMAGTTDPPVVAGNLIREGEGGTGIQHSFIGATITGNTIRGGENGIVSGETPATGAGSLIEGNTIEDVNGPGILVSNADNEIFGNEVLRAADTGIEVESETEDDDGNVIGGDTLGSENVVTDGGGFPIVISGTEGTRNEIRGNRGSGNEGELGFFVLFDVPNEEPNGVEEPTVESAGKTAASGKAEPGAVVRVFFKASAEPGELGGMIGKATADGSGNWTAGYAPVPGETRITATQTKGGGTSRLAASVKTPPDPPKPPVCPEPGATGCETPPPPDTTPPKVTIKKGPKAKSTATTAKFVFSSNEAGSKFKCKLDNKAFANCKSPKTYKKLKPGKHVFKVKATDAAGNASKVVTKKFTVLAAK